MPHKSLFNILRYRIEPRTRTPNSARTGQHFAHEKAQQAAATLTRQRSPDTFSSKSRTNDRGCCFAPK